MTHLQTRSQRALPPTPAELLGELIPEDTALVVDESPSMEFVDMAPNRRQAAIRSATSYLDARIHRGAHLDRFAVVSFAAGARTECRFTTINKIKRIKSAIEKMQIRTSTNIQIGLVQAERLFAAVRPVKAFAAALRWLENKKAVDNSAQRRKRIILLSDGCQNVGRCPLPVADRLKASGVEIDCIGIAGEKSDPHLDEEILKQIASLDHETGLPRYRFISDTNQLVQHYQQLATGIVR